MTYIHVLYTDDLSFQGLTFVYFLYREWISSSYPHGGKAKSVW